MNCSSVVFVSSAVLFYNLSSSVLGNGKQSYEATLLFIYNPASIHFSSFYSESLYSFLSNLIILQYVRSMQGKHPHLLVLIVSVVFITLLRSNSIILVPFFFLPTLLQSIQSPLLIFFATLIGILPMILYLYYNTVHFCPSDSWLPLLACNGSTVYSYVEQKYWNVSLFGYYSWEHVIRGL